MWQPWEHWIYYTHIVFGLGLGLRHGGWWCEPEYGIYYGWARARVELHVWVGCVLLSEYSFGAHFHAPSHCLLILQPAWRATPWRKIFRASISTAASLDTPLRVRQHCLTLRVKSKMPDSFYRWMTPTIHYLTSTTSFLVTRQILIGGMQPSLLA